MPQRSIKIEIEHTKDKNPGKTQVKEELWSEYDDKWDKKFDAQYLHDEVKE